MARETAAAVARGGPSISFWTGKLEPRSAARPTYRNTPSPHARHRRGGRLRFAAMVGPSRRLSLLARTGSAAVRYIQPRRAVEPALAIRLSEGQGSSSSVILIGVWNLPVWAWPLAFRNAPSPPTIGSVSGAPFDGANPVVLISPRPANVKTWSHKNCELFARVSVHAASQCPILRVPAASHIGPLNTKPSPMFFLPLLFTT